MLDPRTWNPQTVVVVIGIVGQVLAYLTIPSVLMRRASNSKNSLSWILALVAIPFFGVIAWWAIGRSSLERRVRRHKESKEKFHDVLKDVHAPPPGPYSSSNNDIVSIHDNEIFPTTTGNGVEAFVSGVQTYPAILKAIENAEHHIHLEFYIWNDDESGTDIRNALIAKAKQGVEVRVLIDAIGSSGAIGRFMKPLKEAGGSVSVLLPIQLFRRRLTINFRNHRKIVVIDGKVGFTGGLNVGDEYNSWYDMFFLLTGPVVDQLQEVFCEDWFAATKENLAGESYFGQFGDKQTTFNDVVARIVASGPDNESQIIRSIFFIAITQAQKEVDITTPYFVPDESILTALKTALLRGVRVRLLVPGICDVPLARIAGRGYFEELLEPGADIFEYQPEILHAKLMCIDDQHAIVGSANLDNRSFKLQFEVNAVLESTAFCERLTQEFEARLCDSKPIVLETFRKRSVLAKFLEATLRLFSPML